MTFIPFFSSTYQLISAGVYYKLGKSKIIEQWLISGTVTWFWYNIYCEEAGTSIGLRFVRKAAETIAGVSIKERDKYFYK